MAFRGGVRRVRSTLRTDSRVPSCRGVWIWRPWEVSSASREICERYAFRHFLGFRSPFRRDHVRGDRIQFRRVSRTDFPDCILQAADRFDLGRIRGCFGVDRHLHGILAAVFHETGKIEHFRRRFLHFGLSAPVGANRFHFGRFKDWSHRTKCRIGALRTPRSDLVSGWLGLRRCIRICGNVNGSDGIDPQSSLVDSRRNIRRRPSVRRNQLQQDLSHRCIQPEHLLAADATARCAETDGRFRIARIVWRIRPEGSDVATAPELRRVYELRPVPRQLPGVGIGEASLAAQSHSGHAWLHGKSCT